MRKALQFAAPGFLRTLIPVLVVFLAWEAVVRGGLVSAQLMPSLLLVFKAFGKGLADGVLLHHAGMSLMRALTGFGLAVIFGVVAGMAMARNRLADALFEPIFSFGYPVPKIALYPLFILALGFGSPSKIALVFLECSFPIAINTFFGMRAVPSRFVWSARNMGASPVQTFLKVLVPAAAPAIFSGLRIALPLALVVVALTEMIGDSSGLGYYISYSSASFEYDKAYAGILAIALVGMTLDRTLVFLRHRVIFWERNVLGSSKS